MKSLYSESDKKGFASEEKICNLEECGHHKGSQKFVSCHQVHGKCVKRKTNLPNIYHPERDQRVVSGDLRSTSKIYLAP